MLKDDEYIYSGQRKWWAKFVGILPRNILWKNWIHISWTAETHDITAVPLKSKPAEVCSNDLYLLLHVHE